MRIIQDGKLVEASKQVVNRDNERVRWVALAVHTALVFMGAPLLYWALTCLQNLPFHFGMLVEAAFGVPASYRLCGLPLLVASAICAGLGRWLSNLQSPWYRWGFGAVMGAALGLALESYFLWHLRGSEGYQSFSIPCSFEGALVGACSSGIWQLCCRWVRDVSKCCSNMG